MPKFCHGKGNLETDGCCWVNGQVCPLRWKIVNNRILEGPDLVDRGTVQEFAAATTNNKQAQQRIVDQAQGLVYACKAAVSVLTASPNLLNNRPGFEQAWADHADYQPIADAWEAIGRPRSWCPTFGPAEGQCCYSEDEATNAAKAGMLSATAVTIRQGRSII